MAYKTVLVEQLEHLAVVTMNRPERLNAIDAFLRQELPAALRDISNNEDIRAVVLTGAGRGFCAGADVKNMALRQSGKTDEQPPVVDTTLPGPLMAIRSLPIPVIAAVNGVATGMGMSISLACDIRIASEQARFASIFIKRSYVPDTGASYMLPRLIGPGKTAMMAYTGKVFDADWALESGLVDTVVPAESLMDEAIQWGQAIAANPPLAIKATKTLLYDNEALEEQVARESAANASMSETADRREAIYSFVEKRAGIFHGR